MRGILRMSGRIRLERKAEEAPAELAFAGFRIRSEKRRYLKNLRNRAFAFFRLLSPKSAVRVWYMVWTVLFGGRSKNGEGIKSADRGDG